MRTLLSILLAVVSVLCAFAASFSSWVARHIVDREGFSKIARPLIEDGEVKDHMTGLASQQAGEQVTQSLPALGSYQDRITGLIKTALDGVVASDRYAPAATESIMTVHDSAFGPGHSASLSLKPMTRLLMESVTQPLGMSAPEGIDVAVPLGAPSVFGRNFFEAVQQGAALWPILLIASILSAFLAVLMARRRALTLGALGVGLVGAGCVARAIGHSAGAYAAGLSPDPFGAILFRKIGDLSAPSLEAEALWLVYGGAAAVVVAFLVGLSAKDRRHSYVTA